MTAPSKEECVGALTYALQLVLQASSRMMTAQQTVAAYDHAKALEYLIKTDHLRASERWVRWKDGDEIPPDGEY